MLPACGLFRLRFKHQFIFQKGVSMLSNTTLSKSEEFNDPSESWHISRKQMANTSSALDLVIGPFKGSNEIIKTPSGKFISLSHYSHKRQWIKNALENQLKMNDKQAKQLSLLMERSMIRAADFSERDWQLYYDKCHGKQTNDQSWVVSKTEMQEIITFLKKDITINTEYCVPYFAGLSDDKKTIYIDSKIQPELDTKQGKISVFDYVILHERVEGAMMEQSYLEQLRGIRKEIKFVSPLNKGNNYTGNLLVSYTLVEDKLNLAYHFQSSQEVQDKPVHGMNKQAADQSVLSYVCAHQIAERLERAVIFSAGFGDVWEDEYNRPVMKMIKSLSDEYESAYKAGQELARKTPPELYILPYMQYTDEPMEAALLWQLVQNKGLIVAPSLMSMQRKR